MPDNVTSVVIITVLGRLGLWKVPYLVNLCPLYSHLICIKFAYVKK